MDRHHNCESIVYYRVSIVCSFWLYLDSQCSGAIAARVADGFVYRFLIIHKGFFTPYHTLKSYRHPQGYQYRLEYLKVIRAAKDTVSGHCIGWHYLPPIDIMLYCWHTSGRFIGSCPDYRCSTISAG